MAKKRGGRRSAPRRSGPPRAAQRAPQRVEATLPSSGAIAPAARAPEPAGAEAGLAGEYRYVLDDLRRIAILAAAMFATLGVLALVIR